VFYKLLFKEYGSYTYKDNLILKEEKIVEREIKKGIMKLFQEEKGLGKSKINELQQYNPILDKLTYKTIFYWLKSISKRVIKDKLNKNIFAWKNY
jgi:hypothetical protein